MEWVDLLSRAVIAALFASSAVGKLRSFLAFVSYLRIPLGRWGRSVGGVVILTEGIFAIALAVGIQVPAVLIAAGLFLLLASAFIALRLVLVDQTQCACWGTTKRAGVTNPEGVGFAPTKRELLTGAVQPAWYGTRNGVLLLGIWLVYTRITDSSHEVTFALVVVASSPAIIAIGLVASIVRKQFLLRLDEHPLKKVLAPHLYPLVALSWYLNGSSENGWKLVSGEDLNTLLHE